MSASAYKKVIKETETPRTIEQKVFSKITGRLQKIVDTSEGTDDREAREALWDNQRLWNTLRTDLMLAANPLPKELKASLISLSHWVDNHTRKVLSGEARVAPLIETNTNIIRGLKGERQ